MRIQNFSQLRQRVLQSPPVSIAVAGAASDEALLGVEHARRAGLIKGALLVGDPDAITRKLQALQIPRQGLEIEAAREPEAIARAGVRAVREGRARILVKGSLDSASYFRAILDRDEGLRAGELLSNLTLFELPGRERLLGVTDNAIIPLPDLIQKQAILANTRPLFAALGITMVKVAAVAAVEKATPQMPATLDAAALQQMSRRADLPGFELEGPLGYDAAIDRKAAREKGLGDSRVAGDPDLLLMPNLEAANILGKAFKYHGGARSGGLVLGTQAPVVLNSRSDGAERRLNSLLLARLLADQPSSAGC